MAAFKTQLGDDSIEETYVRRPRFGFFVRSMPGLARRLVKRTLVVHADGSEDVVLSAYGRLQPSGHASCLM